MFVEKCQISIKERGSGGGGREVRGGGGIGWRGGKCH